MPNTFTGPYRLEMELINASKAFGCTINMLTGGSFTLHENDTINTYNSSRPSWFIKCADASAYHNLSNHLWQSKLQDIPISFEKNGFIDGILISACVMPAVCVGSWMLLLVLMLLPVCNHNSRRRLVLIYVLLNCIMGTVFLHKVTSSIFEEQYLLDYQNSHEILYKIKISPFSKITAFLDVTLGNLTWLQIVYYMFHNYCHTRKRWVPKCLNNNNKRVLFVGFPLFLIHSITLLVSVAHNNPTYDIEGASYSRRSVPLFYTYLFFEYLIICLFILCIGYYVYHDFGHALSYHRERKDNWKNKSALATAMHMVQAYRKVIPVLLYNIIVFLIFFVMLSVNAFIFYNALTWIIAITSFMRVLITVNIWGLIGILERRERFISKKTVLGRRINNKDRLFADPTIKLDSGTNSNDAELLGVMTNKTLPTDNPTPTEEKSLSKFLFGWLLRALKALGLPSLVQERQDEGGIDRGNTETVDETASVETELFRNTIFNHRS